VVAKDQTLIYFGRREYELYSSSLAEGVIEDMSLATFRAISKRLIEEAYASEPTAMALKRVSRGKALVFLSS
jgi:hypothetical protein